jgi:hypothetical protein
VKKLLPLLIAAMFAAVSFSAAAQAPAPSSDTPAATEKKPKKAKKAKKAKKSKKTDDAAAPAAAPAK